MTELPADLLALVAEARHLVSDDRHICCISSETFQSRIVQRRGMVLGGAISPHFLRDSSATSWDVPWMVRLRHCRVVICDKAAHQPLAAWLPLMESIVAAGESLLVVTESIDSELLQTFVVNAFKGSLRVCAVHPARSGNSAPGTRFSTPPATPDQLVRIDDVWIRRSATACFPAATDPLSSAAALEDFAILEVGGENHDDQSDRLRVLMRELQR